MYVIAAIHRHVVSKIKKEAIWRSLAELVELK